MKTREKLLFLGVVAAWLAVLAVTGTTLRQIVADEYLHGLPGHVTLENLPVSTKYVALPILAADRSPTLAKAPFIVYWLSLLILPIALILWMWRADDRSTALVRWTLGMSLYAVVVLGSAILITFSLWLPTRT